jgi:hypothetical protein
LPLGKKRKEIFLQISAVGEMSKDDEAMQAGRQADDFQKLFPSSQGT